MRKFLLFLAVHFYFFNAALAIGSPIENIGHATICINSSDSKTQQLVTVSFTATPMLTETEDCAGAATLADNTMDAGTTVGSADEAIIPPPPLPITGTFGDVWYSYTVPVGMNRLSIIFTGNPNAVVTMYDDCLGANEATLFNATGTCVAVTAGTTYKIRVSNNDADKGSYNITLVSSSLIANPTTLRVCETSLGSGSGNFILNHAEFTPNTIGPWNPAVNSNTLADVDNSGVGMTVTYHDNMADAQNGAPTINDGTYTNGKTIFARVQNASGCFDVAQVTLTTNATPTNIEIQNANNANLPADFSVCEGSQINLIVNPGTAALPVTYAWQIDGTPNAGVFPIASASIATHEGNWVVTVTDNNGCTATDNINITVVASPANDLCGSATTLTTAGLTNQTNICANPDVITNCTANDDHVVWYTFTSPIGMENATITITPGATPISSPAIEVYSGGCGALVSKAFNCGSNTLNLTCLVPGTTYRVAIGTTTLNAGTFDLGLSFSDNGIANEVCVDATDIAGITTCQWITRNMNTTGACPENFTVPTCALNYSTDAVVWQKFTVPAGVTSLNIRNITNSGVVSIFDACPPTATIAGGNCLTGAPATVNINVSAGSTYYIGGGIPGSSGMFDFDIWFNIPPANDLCANAINVNLNANPGLTNVCATQDLTPCTGNLNQASVWYNYTVPPNVKTLTINSGLANSVVEIYQSNCTTLLQGNCTNEVILNCPVTGDIKIMVSSASINAGTFSLTITSVNQTGIDLCSGAMPLPLTQPLCQNSNDFPSNNTGFCPEPASINFGGCDFAAGPATWYTFTTSANTTLLNLEVTGLATNFGLFASCGGAPIAGSCSTGAIINNLTVSPSTTYFLVVAGQAGAEGPFTIKITEKSNPPANDACSSPITVNLGANPGLTNSCATQDLTPCTGNLNQASVWYNYTVPPNVKTLTINSGLANSVVEIYQSNCTTLLQGNCTNEVILNCPVTGDIKIMVSSASIDAGTFSLTITSVNQMGIDLCSGAMPLTLTQPLCQNSNDFASNNTGFCPEPASLNFGGCSFSGGPATWYTFTTSANTTLLNLEVTGLATNFGLFASCGGAPIAGSCSTGAIINNLTVSPSTTYFLVVAGQAGAEGPFTIKITEKSNPPANDACSSPIAVNLGANPGLTNSCATLDLAPCTGNLNQASVWYSYTIPAGVQTLTINTGLTNGVVEIFQSNCNTLLQGECDNEVTLNCPMAQDIRIFVSSASTNAGTFTLTLTQVNSTAVNDACVNATVIPTTPVCQFFAVPITTTVGACPEQFTVVGCALNYTTQPIVWYSFTPPLGSTSIEVNNITATGFLTIFESCPNPNATILPGGGCLSGTGTNGTALPITAGNTYYIAIGQTGAPGNVGFDIKYNQQLTNDNPCLGGFTASPLSNGTALSGENNVCATADNMCGGAIISNTLWYTFTLPAGSDRITVNVTGLTSPSIAIYSQANPCMQVAINQECNGDGMVEFNCLPPGTYSIMVGSSAANAGPFTVTATQGTNAGPINDYCTTATTIVTDMLCVALPQTGSTINSCPEPGLTFFGACNFQTEETSWYIFTAPGIAGDMPTMDFTFTSYTGTGTPFMNVFNFGANCGTLTPVGTQCFQGLNTTFGNIGPLTPGQQYLIAISSIGDTGGNFNFNVKFNIGPPNDDKCHTATGYDLGSGGTLNDQTNLCAGGDYTITACAPENSENSVWYTFTVDPGSYGIHIFINSVGTNGTPLNGTIAAGVFEDGCNSNIISLQKCFPVKTMQVLDCLEPGTYDLQISTSAANAGDFLITTSQLVDDRVCPAGVLSDLCIDAIEIPLAGIFCTEVPTASCNTNACPENFVIPGCSYETNPTVWFKFTVDANAASLDITQMTAGFSYGLLTGNPCTDSPISYLSGFGCNTAVNTLNIPITGGQTYYLIVTNPNPGPFSFNLIQNVFPENDDPNPASPRPPYVLSIGGSHNGSTCCALGFNDGPTLDVANVQCSAATQDGAVWYRYTTGAEVAIKITVTGSGGDPISGPTTVEVLSGSTTAPGNMLFDPNSFSCGPATSTVKIGCYEPGEEMWIKVASANSDCGGFSITIEELDQCPLADECVDVQTVIGPTVTDPNCGSFQTFGAQGCLEVACSQTDISACGAGMLPTVWFQVEVDDDAVQLGSAVNSLGTWDPVWAIYAGPCDNLTLVNGGTIMVPTPCSNGDSNPNVHTVGVLETTNTYYIAVSGIGLIDNPYFSLTVWTSAGCVSCIGEEGCNPEATWTITQRSSPRPLNDPLFCQGEEVTVCVNYLYDASDTGVDWLHGFIPDFGPGWDMSAFDPASVAVSPGNPMWNDQDDGPCAPKITEQMPYLCTYTDPNTGRLRICHTGCQTCPCAGPMLAGSPLPSGWFWSTNGGAGCTNGCSPSTHYGIGQIVVNINFCVDLKVREFASQDECNANRSLRFSFQTTSDGVSGCWNDPVAECKLDFAQIGPPWEVDCMRPPKVEGPNPFLCKQGQLNMNLTNEDGNGNVIIDVVAEPNPNITGANNHTFPGGSGVITDYLTNTSGSTQIQLYIAQSMLPGFICPSPKDTFMVTIYPEVLVNFPEYYICPENASPLTLSPSVSGGSGNYIGTTIPFAPGYKWNTGENTPTISVSPGSTTTYTVTVTDDKGCTGSQQVEVSVKNPVTFNISPLELSLCGGFNDEIVSVSNIVANSPSYTVSWNIPTGLSAFPSGNQLIINPGTSNSTFSPYTVSASVSDNFGCTAIREMVIIIGEPPQADLNFTPPVCGGPTKIDITIKDLYNPSGLDIIYTLLDCDGNVVSGQFGNFIIYNQFDLFSEVDLSLNNCFRLKMETVDASGNVICEVIRDPITIPIPVATPAIVSPPISICAGASTTIAVTNPSAYTGFAWAPAGTGNIASVTVSPAITTQYTVTATQANGCSSIKSVLVTVNPLPVPGISGSTSYCPGESTELTASGGTSYSWSGPGGFTNLTNKTGLINVDGMYIVTVTNMNGCTGSTSATITQSAQLTVLIAPLEICDNMVDSLDAGEGFTTYEWTDVTTSIVGNSQKLGVTLPGTYTVSVTKGACSGTGMGNVVNNITPIIPNLPDTIEVCRLTNGSNLFPSFINFNALIGNIAGTWVNSDDAPVNTTNWDNVDFTTVPSSGFYKFKFITGSAIAPCIDIMDSLVIRVRNCLCPNPTVTFGPVCNSRTIPVALNGNWVGAVNPGTWTVVAGTMPYPSIINDSLHVLNATPGTYTLRYSYTTPLGSCPNDVETIFTISDASTVTGSNITLCNQNIGSGPTTVNLNTLLSNLLEPSPGTWKLIKGATPGGTIPNIDVVGMVVDTLIYEYTTTSNSPCPPQKALVEVRIRDCSCPQITLIADTLCNGSMVLLDLQNPAKFIVDPVGTAGVWSITAPATITNGNFVNPNGVTSGTYVATFTLSGSLPASCTTVFTKNVVIRNQPKVELLNDATACAVSTGNGATKISLFSSLKIGYTTGGTWTQISPALPQLTITNGDVDFTNQIIGTNFVFRYSVNATSPCTPITVDVTVTVKDCNCPDARIECPTIDCNLCNDSGLLDLTTTIKEPTTIAPGTWSVVGGPTGANVPLVNGTILDAKGLTAGNYIIRYTLNPVPSGTCDKFGELKIKIANKLTASVVTDTTVCVGTTGISSIELNDLVLSGFGNGNWRKSATSQTALLNTNLNFKDSIVGNVYTYYFVVGNAAPCTNSIYPTNITVTDNCNCPPIVLVSIPAICTNVGTIDLKLYSDSKPGTWTSTNPLLIITNGILNLANIPDGIYGLKYTLTNPEVGCPSEKSIMINIANPNNAGTARGAEFCLGSTDNVILNDRLDNESIKGVWTVVSGGNTGFSAVPGSFNLTGRPAGKYVFKYAFTNQGACPNDDEDVTITINALPVADAGLDKNIDCTVQTALLGTNLSSSGTNIVYQWKLANNILSTSNQYTANVGGDYTLTVMDTVTKCSASDIVKVIQADDLPIFDIKVDTIPCFGLKGTITLSNIRSGKAPYQISFDGGKTYGSSLVAANLGTGTYKVMVKDANGCINDQLPEIKITEPPLFVIDLGKDFFLNIGEDSLLTIQGQYNEVTKKSVTWKANGVEIASAKDQPTYNAKPEVDTEYSVTVVNESGCIATDNVRISIKRVKPECVPNIFSPNKLDANNYFSINCNEVELVTVYRIYDRWGNLMFSAKNLSPSDPASFWDGNFNGQPVVPGVYAYYLEMLFKDGEVEKRGGDVTVIR